MKIQSLAIIFVIIVLPITIILGEYASTQIEIFRLENLYDSRLITATEDGLKAFQINTFNDAASDIADSKISSIEASVNAFYNSIESSFGLEGYSREDLKRYVPALVYTMYDGYYIYSPYTNVAVPNQANGIDINLDSENIEYGFKPYVYYSCRYKMGANSDFIINYSLDNYITVQGIVNGNSVYKSGYLLTMASTEAGEGVYRKVLPNGIEKYYYSGEIINPEENLSEYLVEKDSNGNVISKEYKYLKLNGTKYYWNEDEEYIFYLIGANRIKQVTKAYNSDLYYKYVGQIEINSSAINYYKDAYEFTKWINDNLSNLRASNAISDIQNKGNYRIFENNQIEYAESNFNMHRKDVIRYSVESNLSMAIANFNSYTDAGANFQMPKLKETEWELLQNEISVISFLQGLNLGGKIYNGYTVITNSKTEEVVKEERIYMTTSDGYYHKINDKDFVNGRNLEYDAGEVVQGVLDLDFEVRKDAATGTYYTNKKQLGCYTSIVGQENVNNTYDSIYEYIQETNIEEEIKQKYYTALGRERWGSYKIENPSEINQILDKMQPDNEYDRTMITDGLIRHLEASNADGYGNSLKPNSTVWKDLSGNRDGIVYGSPVPSRRYVEFDGQNDWVDLGEIKSDTLTIEAMVRFSSTGSYANSYILNNHEAGGIGIYLVNSKVMASAYINGGYKTINSGYTIKPDVTYNISLTYDGQHLKLYVNSDQEFKEFELNAPGKIENPRNSTVMAVGVNPSGNTAGDGGFAKMKVYSIRIYNKALTEEEILDNYELGKLVKITETSVIPAGWSNNGVIVKVTATTLDESGMYKILYKSGENWIDTNWSEKTFSNAESTLTVRGTWNDQYKDYVLYIKAVDNEGNESEIKTVILRNDTIAPKITSLTQEYGTRISVTAEDVYLADKPIEYSGIERIEYSFNGNYWNQDTWGALVRDTNKVSTRGTFSTGYYNRTLYVRAIDYAGNISEVESIKLNGPVTLELKIKVDGEIYDNRENNIRVKLKVDGADEGLSSHYSQRKPYGAEWEVIEIRVNDGSIIPYHMNGKVGATTETIWINLNTITFTVSPNIDPPNSYGTVSKDRYLVLENTRFTTNGNEFIINDGSSRKVTATPIAGRTLFNRWSSESGTITGPRTIIAKFIKDIVSSGLVANYDAKNNTGSGHSNTTTLWRNLSGSNSATVSGGARFSDDHISLDGSNDWINLGQVTSINRVTLEARIELKAIQPGEVIAIANYNTGGVGISIWDGKPAFHVYIEGIGYVGAKMNRALEVGRKYDLTGTYDGSKLKLYVDGELIAEYAQTGTVGMPRNNTVMAIGANPSGNTPGDGGFANINVYSARIYSRALSKTEIQTNIEATK